jgi:16S rRNA (uracil1498-N3)-methyltransferase
LKILQRHTIDRESPVALTLAVALPKGDRQQFLVEKSVELGVARLIPLRTRHSVAEPVGSACRRLRRYVIEASKQCGRNRLLRIEEPMELIELLRGPNEVNETRWLLEEESSRSAAQALPAAVPARLLAAVGPEAGWTDEEREAADAGQWTPISLGRRILRIETAALAIAAWCSLPHNGRR